MGRVSMPQGKGSQMHNRREYEKYGKSVPDNIDASKSSENITLVDKDIKQAYKEFFGNALEKYNDKQKRADRKIENYYEHIQKSKNGEKLFYEDVVQWGSKDDFENPQKRELTKQALIQYASTFEERNPNLRLIGAYIHMDEASPHLHLDYVPIANGYKKGLETRNSLDRAMKQMGFVPDKESRKNNATKLWKDNERVYFGKLCQDLGLEVEKERKARGSLSVEEYKELRDKMVGNIEKEKNALVSEIEPLQKLQTGVKYIEGKGRKMPFGMVAIKKSELDTLKKQAKAYRVNRDEIKNVREHTKKVEQREQLCEINEKEIVQQRQQLQQQYKRQLNLNQLLEQSEEECEKLKQEKLLLQYEISTLKAEKSSLIAEKEKITLRLCKQIEGLKKALRGAYESLANVVKAVGMLKYDRTKDQNGNYIYGKYGSCLNREQERLVDGIAEYGANWAKAEGYRDLAEDMQKRIGISTGIKQTIEQSAPQQTQHSGFSL